MKRETETLKNIHFALMRGYHVLDDGSVIGLKGRRRKDQIGSRGYLTISIRNPDGRPTNIPIHQLAAIQWFGVDVVVDGIEVRHLDNNRHNNSKANIALGTASENRFDQPLYQRVFHARKAAKVLRKLSDKEHSSLLADRAKGMKYKDLMSKYGLAKSTVCYIVNRKTYKQAPIPT